MRLCIECGGTVDRLTHVCTVCSHETKMLDGHLAFAPELAMQSEGFEARYFAKIAELESGSFWFRSRNRLIIWALRQYFPQATSFMEIGCGTGFVLSNIRAEFPSLTLSGSEVFSEGLTFAAERLPGVDLFQMDARCIPFREEFDVIGAFDVLEHIKEDETVLAQIRQATRKGGGILLTVPQHPFLWTQTDSYSRHVRRYRASELQEKVCRAGFTVLRTTSFVSLLMPLLVLSRFKQRFSSRDFDPQAEFKISRFADAILEKTLNGERRLIESGASFPVGGSLLVVARRE